MSPFLLNREDLKDLKASFFFEVLAVLAVQKRCRRDARVSGIFVVPLGGI